MEDIKLPEDVTHVDVIISEWMGYALLYESMLDSVLKARDRFLKPEGGVMAPSQCRMMLGLCEASEIFKERIGFWGDVYGTEPLVGVLEGISYTRFQALTLQRWANMYMKMRLLTSLVPTRCAVNL